MLRDQQINDPCRAQRCYAAVPLKCARFCGLEAANLYRAADPAPPGP
jgi:hypothetical protein